MPPGEQVRTVDRLSFASHAIASARVFSFRPSGSAIGSSKRRDQDTKLLLPEDRDHTQRNGLSEGAPEPSFCSAKTKNFAIGRVPYRRGTRRSVFNLFGQRRTARCGD